MDDDDDNALGRALQHRYDTDLDFRKQIDAALSDTGLRVPRPERPVRHPIGPDVAAGDLVRVLRRAGGRELPEDAIGEVQAPGYNLARIKAENEAASRVISVRLSATGDYVDATAWELTG